MKSSVALTRIRTNIASCKILPSILSVHNCGGSRSRSYRHNVGPILQRGPLLSRYQKGLTLLLPKNDIPLLSGRYYRCYSDSRRFLASSSSSTTATTNNNDHNDNNNDPQNTNKSSSRKQKIFPWRENATEPLSRLLQKDDLSGQPNSTRSRFIKKVTVGVEMKVPLWQLFFTGPWEKELAQNCSLAFQNALAGLISWSFRVPLSSIENNDKFLKFDYDVEINDGDADADADDEDDNADDDYIQAMVEENLLKLYTRQTSSSHDTEESIHDIRRRDITKAHFYLEPISSRLENIFLIPSLTRDDVKQDESLRGAFTAIERAYQETGDVKVISDMANSLMSRVSHGGSNRSIIMDVSINCLETLYIKAGDELIQGDDTRVQEEVTHLVRFEMQTTKGVNDAGGRERELGSWYIIDIDDQLNGNVWH